MTLSLGTNQARSFPSSVSKMMTGCGLVALSNRYRRMKDVDEFSTRDANYTELVLDNTW